MCGGAGGGIGSMTAGTAHGSVSVTLTPLSVSGGEG